MDISNQNDEVKAVCNTVWTDAIKNKWQEYQESLPPIPVNE